MRFGTSNPDAQLAKVLLGTLAFGDVGVPKDIGYLPKGATIIKRRLVLGTAFNGTTPLVTIGTETQAQDGTVQVSDPDALMAAGDITEGTPATYDVDGHVACDATYRTKVTASFSVASGTPTTGAADVEVWYVDNDV